MDLSYRITVWFGKQSFYTIRAKRPKDLVTFVEDWKWPDSFFYIVEITAPKYILKFPCLYRENLAMMVEGSLNMAEAKRNGCI